MIYLDASAVLARVFAEDRFPADGVWHRRPVSSRLLQYEVWNRIYARGVVRLHGNEAESLLDRVEFIALETSALSRALEPFPVHVRTLDALHLATMDYLRSRGQAIELLSYDQRMLAAAQAMGIAVYAG